ncbi:MAG: DUF4339 domain-containing protein [Elusimicrobiota bacterium]
MTRYWVRISKQSRGPFTPEEFRNLDGISEDSMVFRDGATDKSAWKRLREVPELLRIIKKTAPAPRPLPSPQSIKKPPAQTTPRQEDSPPQQSRSKLPLVGGILLVALIAGGGGGGYWWIQRQKPEGVAKRYLAALKSREYKKAYELLSDVTKAHTESSAFESYQRRSGAKEWSFESVALKRRLDDHVVMVGYVMAVAEKKSEVQLLLVEDRGAWRVAHSATLFDHMDEAEAKKDYAEVIKTIQNLYEISPGGNGFLDVQLAIAYVNKAVNMQPGPGKDLALREAVVVARKAASGSPNNYSALSILALAQRNAELLDDAQSIYSKALGLAETPREKAKSLLGRAICRAGLMQGMTNPNKMMTELKAIIDDLKKARQLDPGNVEVQQVLTRLRHDPMVRLLEKKGRP